MTSAPQHVAIVGCGFTGTSALYQLVHSYPVRKITVFETHSTFGPGFPYQLSESREYLINNTNDTMCLPPSNRRAFVEWLKGHETYAGGLDEKGHTPRSVYGEFLREVIEETRRGAEEKGIEVELIRGECLDTDERGYRDLTVVYDGGSVDADIAILATGRCPNVDVFELGAESDDWFPTHMPGLKFSHLPLDARVHILGASLSAYDVINQLYSHDTGCEFVPSKSDRLRFVPNGNERTVTLCSRSGRLKKAQSRHPIAIARRHFNAEAIEALPTRGTTIGQVFELMHMDAAEAGIELDLDTMLRPYDGCNDLTSLNDRARSLLQADIDAACGRGRTNYIVDYLEHAQLDIWDLFAANKLTEAEEARYRSTFESALLTWAAPCPIPTAQKILALMEAGRLKVIAGTGSVTRDDSGGFAIEHAFGSESADIVVNATGAVDRQVRSQRQSTLIRNLARRRLLRPYILNGEESPGVAVDMDTLLCEGSKNIYAANMFLWGPGSFTSSAFVMATVVRRLLERLFVGPQAPRSI